MMRAVAVFAAVLGSTAALHAQQPAAPPDSCGTHLIPYEEWSSVAATDPAWSLVIEESSGGGALHYFGAIHSRDPSHDQFAALRRAWSEFRPTFAFYEGPDRGIAEDEQGTIAQMGESGYVRFLADRDGARLGRLEPDPQEEIAYVLERFTPEQVKLFFVLREAQRLREREGLSEEQIRGRIAELLDRAKQLEGIGLVITTVDELALAYADYWTAPAEWWQAPSEWFDPLLPSERTGGIFTNDVNRASSEFRNLSMYRVLASAALGGERVFAVVGRNHVPMQAAALRCALLGAQPADAPPSRRPQE